MSSQAALSIDDVTEAPERVFKKLPPDEMEKLILDHREHGKRLAWSFLTTWRIRMQQDEVISVVGAALCEAANRFDSELGVAFKTFFFYHLRGMLLKEISRMIQEQRMLQVLPTQAFSDPSGSEHSIPLEWAYPVIEQNNPERLIERRETAQNCWIACAQLDPLEQEVLIRYFVHDESLVTIAEDLKYCRCHISRVKSRALAKLQQILREVEGEEPQPVIEVETIEELPRVGKAASSAKLRSYTGGRGRRKSRNSSEKVKSKALELLLAHG